MEPRPHHVLIVDDEPAVGLLIREELSEHGLVCWVAKDAAHAKSFIDSQPLDVLIADIQMPWTSGLELLAYVGKQVPRCKVILITGNSKRQHIAQALLLGAYDYLEKPFKAGELVDVVLKAVQGEAGNPALVDRAIAAMQMSSVARQTSLDSVRALVRAVEAKDPYTRRHSEQVAHYAVHFAQRMGMPASSVESIYAAALLHDIGKIGVPDHILSKQGPLTEEEFRSIRRHPDLGADILSSITIFSGEAKWVRHHHETWDGKGYPDGLVKEESPLVSRIIQVADSIDAMLMERTYKQGYPVKKMLDELARCAGSQFDPTIAALASQWCRSNSDKLILPGRRCETKALSA